MARKLKLSSLKSNLKRQFDGDWVDYPIWPGVRFNVSSSKSPDYQAASRKTAERFAKKYKGEDIPIDELSEANAKDVANHLLHGWDGLDESYSEELALARMTEIEFDGDEPLGLAYESLIDAVLWCANKLARVDAEYIADVEKNSEAPSDTI